MLEQSLNGARGVWQFREAGQGEWMPAEAPAATMATCWRSAKSPIPLSGRMRKKANGWRKGIGNTAAAFFVDQALLQMDEVFLHCEMLDTLCEVFVNGILAGRGKNMHLRYDFFREAISA